MTTWIKKESNINWWKNYILDFVDKELLEHRKRKEKVTQEENLDILQATIKKQEKINNLEKIEKNQKTDSNINNIEEEIVTEIIEKSVQKESKDKIQIEAIQEKKQEVIGISNSETPKNNDKKTWKDSLEDLMDEKIIPLQQKNKNSIVSEEIMNILEWSNVEQSILSFNGEDEDMETNSSKAQKLEKKNKEEKLPKKKNKINTILFQAIVGIILIIISVLYLVDSPAEQKVLKSGMSIWIDKIEMLLWNSNKYFHDRFLTDLEETRNWLLVDIDYSLEKAKNCNMTWISLEKDIQQLENLRKAIDWMSLENFKKQHMSIEMQVQSIENWEIIKQCY